MKHVKITAFDLPDAWYQVLNRIWKEGEPFQVTYGSEITKTKKLGITLEVIHPENKPIVPEKAPCDIKYVMKYFLEYLWLGEKKLGETYTYSSRLRHPVDQIDEAIQRFVEELFDRQVTLVVRIPQDIFKEIANRRHDPPCLTMLDLEINSDEKAEKLKLNITGYWRSWDAYAALPANLAGLQLFSAAFVNELNSTGSKKHGNTWENVSTGTLIMHSKNCHIYQRQFALVDELLKLKRPTFGESIRVRRIDTRNSL